MPKANPRVTHFTAEQQAAIIEACALDRFIDKGEFVEFFTTLIETGARTHVEAARFTKDRLKWDGGKPVLLDMRIVKRKPRLVFLSPKMQTLIAELAERYPSGPLFRNSKGDAWTNTCVQDRFSHIRTYLIKTKPELGLTKEHVLYPARHTFVIRMLERHGGDVALVAELAGNTIAVLEKHYKAWCANTHRCLAALA